MSASLTQGPERLFPQGEVTFSIHSGHSSLPAWSWLFMAPQCMPSQEARAHPTVSRLSPAKQQRRHYGEVLVTSDLPQDNR
ncbi:hypothetical protein E2C01_085002 [Portunus trituberculatus]|uniref:Uncharacterized protein n=1 Tax=Portunus trituberculatus TaxID=210409 RepID=A0A5B7J5H6_PORTR|nr:hypothetical protein [Portunus trituberculatus]